jgi:RNA 2',3'-cyclic 3'-phosphodiesterase
MHRLFVALRPAAWQRDALHAWQGGVPAARWQDDEQLHVTLRFIGSVDPHRAEDVAAALGGVAAPAIDLAFRGTGSFGMAGREHSLWAGAHPVAALNELKRAVDRALVRVGVEPDPRAYRPHVTLARLSGRDGAVQPWRVRTMALDIGPARIDTFALFESHLGQAGALYETIARYPLQG